MGIVSPPAVVGTRYTRLTILSESEMRATLNGKGKRIVAQWVRVICDCGTEKELLWYKVRTGHTQSCGCYQKSQTARVNFRHGESRTPLHMRWSRIVGRCTDPGDQAWNRYGGRGIVVCDEWLLYENFRDWALSNGYQQHLEIDRRDNDRGYSPDNCRFVDRKTNTQNTCRTRFLTAFGETKCMAEWGRDPRCQVTPGWVRKRIAAGMSPETALTKPPRSRGRRRKNTTDAGLQHTDKQPV